LCIERRLQRFITEFRLAQDYERHREHQRDHREDNQAEQKKLRIAIDKRRQTARVGHDWIGSATAGEFQRMRNEKRQQQKERGTYCFAILLIGRLLKFMVGIVHHRQRTPHRAPKRHREKHKPAHDFVQEIIERLNELHEVHATCFACRAQTGNP